MKRFLLILSVICLSFSLAACSSGKGTTGSTVSEENSKAENSAINSTDTGIENGDDTANGNTTGLKDGKYTAEGKSYGEDGYKPYVEIAVENGKITEVDCDAVDENGDFKKDDDKAKDWDDKISLFEDEVVAKGLESIAINDDGTVSNINGMDLVIGDYADLLNEAINKAKG